MRSFLVLILLSLCVLSGCSGSIDGVKGTENTFEVAYTGDFKVKIDFDNSRGISMTQVVDGFELKDGSSLCSVELISPYACCVGIQGISASECIEASEDIALAKIEKDGVSQWVYWFNCGDGAFKMTTSVSEEYLRKCVDVFKMRGVSTQ